MAKRDYLVEAAKQFRMALDSEVSEDYEAAFSYYKNGVDLLLNGVQRELMPSKSVLTVVTLRKIVCKRHVMGSHGMEKKQEVTSQRLKSLFSSCCSNIFPSLCQ